MRGYIFTIILAAVVVGYAIWAVMRQVKKYKTGKDCGCGCEHCLSKTSDCGADFAE